MAHATLGRKQRCASCGIKFYDLKKSPAVCPSCGTEFDPETLLKSRRGRVAAKDEAEKAPSKADAVVADDDLIEKSDDEFESEDEVLSTEDELVPIASDDDEDEAEATGAELIDVLDDELGVDDGAASDEDEDDL